MRTRFVRPGVLPAAYLAALGLLAFVAPAAHTQARYTITGLFGLGLDSSNHVNSVANALNNRGQIGGNSDVYSANHIYKSQDAFLFDGILKDLGNLGANTYSGTAFTGITGINDAGQVVGYTAVYNNMSSHNESRSFRVPFGGSITPITVFGSAANGDVNSYPLGINNAGIVVGFANFYDDAHVLKDTAPFRYDTNTNTKIALPTNGTSNVGHGYGVANAINDAGQIVGTSEVYDAMHNDKGEAAFVYSNNITSYLGNLGTNSSGRSFSGANAISGTGQIVGYSYGYRMDQTYYGSQAVRFQNGTPIPLGNLGVDSAYSSESRAYGVNNRGQIVGSSDIYTNQVYQGQGAFLYQNGVLKNLNDLIAPGSGWSLQRATAINNRGQIVGYGLHNGATEGFLLTPFTAGDFNRDGNPDLLFQNAATGAVSLSALNGVNSLFTQSITSGVPAEWRVGAVCDVNGDGSSDIVWQNTKNGNVLAWLMNNGAYAGYAWLSFGVPTNYKLVGNGDFNGDGYPDLLWQNTTTGSVAVWYLAGTVIYDAATLTNGLGTGWNLTGIADIDSDGKPDLLWRNTTSGDLYVWLMDGTTLKTNGSKKITTLPSVWQLVATGDYNADGQDDLIWQNTSTGAVAAWLMSGTTVTSAVNVASGFGAGWNVIGPR